MERAEADVKRTEVARDESEAFALELVQGIVNRVEGNGLVLEIVWDVVEAALVSEKERVEH